MTIDEPSNALDDTLQEEAQGLIDMFRESFPTFRQEWESRSESERAAFAQVIGDHVLAAAAAATPETLGVATVRGASQMESLMRERGVGDLARISQQLPHILGSGSPAAHSVHHILLRVASCALDVILAASSAVLNARVSIDELDQAIESLALVLTDALRTVPTSIAQDDAAAARERLDTAASAIDALSRAESRSALFVSDAHVLKAAARGHEANLILYTLKQTLWDKCNSIRILTQYLLCALRGAWDSNKASCSLLNQLPATTSGLIDTVKALVEIVETSRALTQLAPRNTEAHTDEQDEDQHIWQEFCRYDEACC
jgi:hypothetical protein